MQCVFFIKHFKRSMLFTMLLSLGAYLFTFFKKSNKVLNSRKVEAYLVFSNDELLKNTHKRLLEKNTEYQLNDFKKGVPSLNKTITNIEVVLDNKMLTFKRIILFLELNKNKNYSFKIKPKESNFIIGSNSSLDRGQIIKLKTE